MVSVIKEKESDQVEEKKEEKKKWLLVYTEYGYAEVDMVKFQEQIESMEKEKSQYLD